MFQQHVTNKHSLTHSLTHSWSWALLEKLSILQLLKNIPSFYGTRRFITVFTRALHWSLSFQSIPSYLSKVHFNIVHPPTPWSSLWSLSFWLSHQYPIRIPRNRNYIREEINRRLNSGNVCYNSVQILRSSRPLSRNVNIKMHTTVNFPVVPLRF
jgi:hypothetical protein